jgi:ParB family chromosome partitioning protein
LLLRFVTDTFRTSGASGSCVEVSVRHVYMLAQSPELKDSVVAKSVDARHAAWEEDLPLGDDAALWDYLSALDQGNRLALLAHCLSFGINAMHEKVNPYGAGMVIPPFLTGCIRRTYAAIFSFMAGVMPPMPMLGRSLL